MPGARQGGSKTRPAWVAFALCTLLATGCSNVKAPPAEAPAPAPAATVPGAYRDDPGEPSADAAAVIAAGKDPAKLAALERGLLAAMQAPGATPAEVQDAAQHLGYVLLATGAEPNSPTLAALAPMLVDDARVEFARLALDRVPGAAVDTLYVQSLQSSTGPTRLALIQSVGERAIASAVPALGSLFGQADPATAAATTRALGRIGGAAALSALDGASQPLAPDVLNARLAAAAKADAGTLARTAEAILRNPAAPLPQRSAALRCLIGARPASAVSEIHAALIGTEPALQQVAIESVATLSTPGAAAELASNLGSYAPLVQTALIAALGSRGDAGAIPGLLKVVDGMEADVRLAAIDALGRLPGTTDVAQRLAELATGSGAEAKAAGSSLARLSGPGLDDFVRAGAATGDVKLRAVYIQQIAGRNLTDAIPFLLGLRTSSEASLRLEALDALRAIAPPAQQQAIIDWALGATSKAEQARAVRALITIILRDDATETRANAVIAAIEGGNADARVALLPILPRVSGAKALATAGRFALDADETAAVAAVTELARWPDDSALPLLVDVAGKSTVTAVRDAAVRGAADFLARSENVSREQRSAQARAMIGLPVGVREKNALLNVLSLCADAPALETAKRFLADPATADTARDAVDAITSNLAGPPDCKASHAVADLAKLSDGRVDTSWSVPNAPGEWLFVDLKHSRPVRKLTLDQGGRGWGFPAQVEIFVSDDPAQQGEARAQAEGERGKTIVTLPAGIRGRYVWIQQTGTRDPAWSIAELAVE